jgi:cell division transport system permease protein
MNGNHLLSLLKRAADGARRRPWLHVFSVCTLFSTFLCFALTLAFAQNLDRIIAHWVRGAELTVYVKDGVPPADVDRLIAALSETKEIERVDRIGEDRAQQIFAAEMGEFGDMVRALPKSAFPLSVEVNLKDSYSTDAEARKHLADRISALSMVDKVDLYDEWFSKLDAARTASRIVSWGLGFSALIVAILVISATVRSGISARAREIEVLSLVGATERYIRFPFLLEGAMEAALAMGLAVVCLEALLSKAESALTSVMPFIGVGSLSGFSVQVSLMLIGGSALAGMLGSRLSLNSVRQEG